MNLSCTHKSKIHKIVIQVCESNAVHPTLTELSIISYNKISWQKRVTKIIQYNFQKNFGVYFRFSKIFIFIDDKPYV